MGHTPKKGFRSCLSAYIAPACGAPGGQAAAPEHVLAHYWGKLLPQQAVLLTLSNTAGTALGWVGFVTT